MGRDPALTTKHPSVIINGSRYYYGHHPDPQYDYFLVEHESYEKDYWWFNEKEDLVAFLVNLPDSADRDRRLKLHPDWHDVTSEQRSAYINEDRLALRALAEEKVKNGTARSFSMDLDGEQGPYEPQRIEVRSKEPPIKRVERKIADHKAAEAVNAERAGYPIEPGEWPRGYSETLKLRVLEAEIDWTGVSPKDKEAILAREVNFAAITPAQFKFVYADIAFEKVEPPDPAVAQALFDRSRAETASQHIRDTTRSLVGAIAFDIWPPPSAVVDFGLKSQEHYEALYYPVRSGEITPKQLDAALGKGAELTALARSAQSNPHRDIDFHTEWDEILSTPAHDADGRASPMPSPGAIAEGQRVGVQEQLSSPGEIADRRAEPESPELGRGTDRGNGR